MATLTIENVPDALVRRLKKFVALAEDLGTRLVTGDDQVLNAFPDLAATPAESLPRG